LAVSEIVRIFAGEKRKNKNMANAMTMPIEGQLIKTTIPRRRLSSYDRSLRDLDEGRVYEAKDVDDLFKQCLG
jgi:hypothetical protein